MPFRCLHPMELDTGPWPKKSSILCSLLLLLATFSVLQVTGQAETVGLGNHTLLKDGKVNLNTNKDYNYFPVKKSIDFNKHKILFPGACNVTIKNGFIELKYEGKLCTVDLLSDFNDKIKFKAEVRDKTNLSKCFGQTRKKSHLNLLPFIYNKDKEEIKRFSEYGPSNRACKDEKECKKTKGGECLNETSLEISWHREGDDYYLAYIHLIRELEDGLKAKGETGNNKKKMIFDLEIREEGSFTMINSSKKNTFNSSNVAVCAQENNTIVEPKAWTINNTLLKDEYLLVFSMLPTSVSKAYYEEKFGNESIPSEPKCELFIQFDTKDYRLLTATSTCTTPSTTAQTTTTEAPSTTTIFSSTESEQITTPKECPTTKLQTTIRPTEKTCPEEPKTFLIVMLIIGWLLVAAFLLFVGALCIYRWMEEKERKERRRKEREAFVPKPEQTEEQAEEEHLRTVYDTVLRNKGMKTHGSYGTWKKTRNIRFKENFHLEMKHPKIYQKEYVPELTDKGFAVVGTFEEWFNKNKSATATSTMIEQPPTTTKTALGTDKSEVDKGKSTKTALDAEKPTTTVIEIPQNAEESKAEGTALEEAKPDENGEVKSKAGKEA